MKWLVTALSTTNILLAWAAFYFLPKHPDVAFTLLFCGLLGDLLDGFLARRWQVTSRTGTWLDSLSDVALYLLFPLRYWVIHNGLPLPVALVVMAAGIFRLIRFSLRGFIPSQKGLSYAGVPVYYLQIVLAVTLVAPLSLAWLIGMLVAISVLMVSTIPIRKASLRTFVLGLGIYVVLYFFSRHGN